ncbi:MAG: serine hydrolase domain-containing protein [Planctomycetota bacterium]
MRTSSMFGIASSFVLLANCAMAEVSNGLAPEVTDLNAKDVSYALEKKIPYLEQPYISVAPKDMGDGIPVGRLGVDGGDRDMILKFAEEIARPSPHEKTGRTDSLLICYKGKLVFESYYRRGRANYPHYQMSITKAYTSFALGRAMQLGYIKPGDLHRPAIDFLKEVDRTKIVSGADRITLDQAMTMGSGIRLSKEKAAELRRKPALLKGQGQIQAYLQHSAPIPEPPRQFKYQASDPAMTMQVVEAVVPGTAKDFIRNELLGKMGISNYHWQNDTSGLPKSAAGCSFRSRDMLKMGMLVLGKGKWKGEQLIPADFIDRATSPIVHSYGTSYYGYFWWVDTFKVDGNEYQCREGRGAGGQFIMMFPELDLIAVITAHNKGMGRMLQTAPRKLIPAFAK